MGAKINMEELSVKKIGKQSYVLLEDVTVNSLGYQIKLLKGFDFDAASIPKVFWSIIGSPFTGNYTTPAPIIGHYQKIVSTK